MTIFESQFIDMHLYIRLILAVVFGIIIGYERHNRYKNAGIRTHVIVCLGATLLMIISKYGFIDVIDIYSKIDPSRIASSIATGVGFLGAGTIIVKNRNVTGLTTAAGIFTTAAIGMAVGAGMYILSFTTTMLVVIVQTVFFYSNTYNNKIVKSYSIDIVLLNTSSFNEVKDALSANGVEISSFKLNKKSQAIDLEMEIECFNNIEVDEIINYLSNNDNVKSFNLY